MAAYHVAKVNQIRDTMTWRQQNHFPQFLFFIIMIIWVVKFSKDDALKGNFCTHTIIVPSRQKLGTSLENKMFRKKEL